MVTLFYYKKSEHQKTLWTEYLKSQPNSDYTLELFERSYKEFPDLFDIWPVQPWFFPVDFITSHVAQKNEINNIPSESYIWDNIVTLLKYYLIPLRDKLKIPIVISSGYRCPELNKAVNGAVHSYHMQGRACDIMCNNNLTLYNALARLAISHRKSHNPILTELIQYTNFIHFAI